MKLSRALVAVALAAASVVLPSSPGHATTSARVPADRLERVAAGLRRDRLFVDPDMAFLLDAAERRKVRKAIGSAGFPVYVVIIPMFRNDESGGDSTPLLCGVYRRLGGRPGVYVIANQFGRIGWEEYEVPRNVTLQDVGDLSTGEGTLKQKANSTAVRLPKVVNAIADAPAKPAPPASGECQRGNPSPGTVRNKTPGGDSAAPDFAIGLGLGALGTAVLAWLGWLLVLFAGRTLRRTAPLGPVDDAPARPSPGWLTGQAQRGIVKLREAIAANPPDGPGRRRALAAYDAAALLYDERDDPIDRLGVIVLARAGHDALAGETHSPCFINPLHGPARRRVRVVGSGRKPVCESCLKAGADSWPERTLMIGDVPYHQAPGHFDLAASDLPQRALEHLRVE